MVLNRFQFRNQRDEKHCPVEMYIFCAQSHSIGKKHLYKTLFLDLHLLYCLLNAMSLQNSIFLMNCLKILKQPEALWENLNNFCRFLLLY